MVSYKPQDDLHDPGQAHTDEHHAHATPLWILFAVFGSLVFLTFLTVFFAHPFVKEHIRIFVNDHFYNMTAAEVSRFSLHLAMGIATLKGALVVLFFMHLWWDRPFNAIVFISTLAFAALFIGYTLADVTTYTKNERSIRSEMDARFSAEQLRVLIEARRAELAEGRTQEDSPTLEPEIQPDETTRPVEETHGADEATPADAE